MPVRPRRERVATEALTLRACLLLSIGLIEEPTDAELRWLRRVWDANRDYFESRRNPGEVMWADRFEEEA